MMALILILGVGLGWVVHRANVQRDAVAAIRRAGGRATYEWEVTRVTGPSGDLLQPNPNGRPRGPRWLIRSLGLDYFGSVVGGELGPRDGDTVMAHVGRLDRLEVLAIGRAPLTEAGASHLRALRGLKDLHLGRAARPGLKSIEGLRRLQRLDLREIPITDADLIPLRGLTDLQFLAVRSPNLTDAGMAHLRNLTRVKTMLLAQGRGDFRWPGPDRRHVRASQPRALRDEG